MNLTTGKKSVKKNTSLMIQYMLNGNKKKKLCWCFFQVMILSDVTIYSKKNYLMAAVSLCPLFWIMPSRAWLCGVWLLFLNITLVLNFCFINWVKSKVTTNLPYHYKQLMKVNEVWSVIMPFGPAGWGASPQWTSACPQGKGEVCPECVRHRQWQCKSGSMFFFASSFFFLCIHFFPCILTVITLLIRFWQPLALP